MALYRTRSAAVYGIDALDPVLNKVLEIGTSKKIAALLGSLVYFTPPVPFLVGIAGERVVKRLNSVPVHDVNGNTPLLN